MEVETREGEGSSTIRKKVIQKSGQPIIDVELFQEEDGPPCYSIYWPTRVLRRDGVQQIFRRYTEMRSSYQIPSEYRGDGALTINCNSKESNFMELSFDPKSVNDPDEFTENLFNYGKFNPDFSWFRLNTPYADLCLDGKPLNGAPHKIIGVIGSRNLTAETVCLFRTTTNLIAQEQTLIQIGLHLREIFKGFPKMNLLTP